MKVFRMLIIGFIWILVVPPICWADGLGHGRGAGADREPEATPNQASDASFDKRLPPVLPGETVSDSGGKLRVWSTAGPVPVASAPEPWRDNSALPNGSATNGGIGVIVDQREHGQRAGTPNQAPQQNGNMDALGRRLRELRAADAGAELSEPPADTNPGLLPD